jgi:hypothetical protein
MPDTTIHPSTNAHQANAKPHAFVFADKEESSNPQVRLYGGRGFYGEVFVTVRHPSQLNATAL